MWFCIGINGIHFASPSSSGRPDHCLVTPSVTNMTSSPALISYINTTAVTLKPNDTQGLLCSLPTHNQPQETQSCGANERRIVTGGFPLQKKKSPTEPVGLFLKVVIFQISTGVLERVPAAPSSE